MIYKRKRHQGRARAGFYRFENQHREHMFGFSDGDFVRLRDEYGNVWRGQADYLEDKTVRLMLKDSAGNQASGLSDEHGVVLRDAHGNTWRGIVD